MFMKYNGIFMGSNGIVMEFNGIYIYIGFWRDLMGCSWDIFEIYVHTYIHTSHPLTISNTPHCMVINMWFHPLDPPWFRLGLFNMNRGWDYNCILVALPNGWIWHHCIVIGCSMLQSQIAKQSIPKKDTAMLISARINFRHSIFSATLFQKFCVVFFPNSVN